MIQRAVSNFFIQTAVKLDVGDLSIFVFDKELKQQKALIGLTFEMRGRTGIRNGAGIVGGSGRRWR